MAINAGKNKAHKDKEILQSLDSQDTKEGWRENPPHSQLPESPDFGLDFPVFFVPLILQQSNG